MFQRDHEKSKLIREQEERLMVSAWYNLVSNLPLCYVCPNQIILHFELSVRSSNSIRIIFSLTNILSNIDKDNSQPKDVRICDSYSVMFRTARYDKPLK